jgi:hypothetical protein
MRGSAALVLPVRHYFTLADHARAEIEPRLRAEIGPNAAIE